MAKRRPGSVPLYQQIKDALIEQIAAGQYKSGQPFVTEREVRERFEVSTITAVRALNDLVAEGVLVRRRGLGTFVVEPVGRSHPRSGRGGTIACIMHGLHGLGGRHMSQILTGTESACSRHGYQMSLANSADSHEREEDALRRALDNEVAGIVLYPVQGQAHGKIFAEIRRHGTPLVMIDRFRTDVVADAVVADNTDLGYQVTDQLAEYGHTRIATLWGETECTSVRDRRAGHVQALRDRGLPVMSEWTVLRPYEPLSADQRRRHLAALLESDDPPTVFVCANGYVLAAAAHDLLSLGIHVPEEVELACMDDAGPYDMLPLALVAGVLPSMQMAERAVELLVRRIGKVPERIAPQQVTLPVTVVHREHAAGHLRTVAHGRRDPPPPQRRAPAKP